MSDRYVATVAVHVLAALVWLGGMMFFAVLAPVLRRVPDDATRAALFQAVGRRFRLVGWICVGVLLITGLEQLRLRGWWGSGFWNAEVIFGTSVGTRLSWKLGLVAAIVGVQAFHDFWIGPRAGRAAPGSPEARALRARAALLARLSALLGVALVYAAVRLGR
ncbi:MAG TPA: DUF4149 domain-containing protein [Longimicrobiales bacterium]|nr:DUF4149 domain-containing protein [Longimicrobiales bacterium]